MYCSNSHAGLSPILTQLSNGKTCLEVSYTLFPLARWRDFSIFTSVFSWCRWGLIFSLFSRFSCRSHMSQLIERDGVSRSSTLTVYAFRKPLLPLAISSAMRRVLHSVDAFIRLYNSELSLACGSHGQALERLYTWMVLDALSLCTHSRIFCTSPNALCVSRIPTVCDHIAILCTRAASV